MRRLPQPGQFVHSQVRVVFTGWSPLQELEALGFGCVLSEGWLDVVKLLNSLHGLLQLHRSTVTQMETIVSRSCSVYVCVCV